MANEVMQSLFGLSSYDAGEALRQKQTAEDYAYARLDPKQQIIFDARQAGRSIGGGVNQLFGLVPEGLQRVRNRENALMQVQEMISKGAIDINDNDAVTKALITQLSGVGDTQGASMVLGEYLKGDTERTRAQAALKRAEGDKESSTRVERETKHMQLVEGKLRAGESPTHAELTLALDTYHNRTKDRQENRYDPYGNPLPPVTVRGDVGLLNVFPLLHAVYTKTSPAAAVQPTAEVPLSAEGLPLEQPPAAAAAQAPTGLTPEQLETAARLGVPANVAAAAAQEGVPLVSTPTPTPTPTVTSEVLGALEPSVAAPLVPKAPPVAPVTPTAAAPVVPKAAPAASCCWRSVS